MAKVVIENVARLRADELAPGMWVIAEESVMQVAERAPIEDHAGQTKIVFHHWTDGPRSVVSVGADSRTYTRVQMLHHTPPDSYQQLKPR